MRQTAPDGREILLYRLTPGETCLQTALCLLGDRPYAAEARAETRIEATILPPDAFDALLTCSPAFRRRVFASVAARLEDFSRQVARLAFAPLSARVALYLADNAGPDGAVDVTHERIARALGVAREAVSRHLAVLRRAGLTGARRGRIVVLDADALRARAAAATA